MYGAGHTYFISAEPASDAHGIASMKFMADLIGGLNVTITGATWSVTCNVPYNTGGQHPFGIIARDTRGNETSRSYWCEYATNTATPAYLACTPE